MTNTQKARIRKWIQMLRSGYYKQGYGALLNGITDQYCCLGVACDLYATEVGGFWNGDVRSRWTEFVPDQGSGETFLAQSTILPMAVLTWLGLDRDQERQLINWNDVRNLPFDKIAGRLEKWLKA